MCFLSIPLLLLGQSKDLSTHLQSRSLPHHRHHGRQPRVGQPRCRLRVALTHSSVKFCLVHHPDCLSQGQARMQMYASLLLQKGRPLLSRALQGQLSRRGCMTPIAAEKAVVGGAKEGVLHGRGALMRMQVGAQLQSGLLERLLLHQASHDAPPSSQITRKSRPRQVTSCLVPQPRSTLPLP